MKIKISIAIFIIAVMTLSNVSATDVYVVEAYLYYSDGGSACGSGGDYPSINIYEQNFSVYMYSSLHATGYCSSSRYARSQIVYDPEGVAGSELLLSVSCQACDTITTSYTERSIHALGVDYANFRAKAEKYAVTCEITTRAIIIGTNDSINSNYIKGDIDCVSDISFSIYNGTDYIEFCAGTAGANYEYAIVEGIQYKLEYDGSEYVFVAGSTNITYDINACSYTTIYLKDYCGNNMRNTSVDIYKSDSGAPASYEFVGNYHRINPIELLVSDIGEGKMLDIYFDTDMGEYHQIEYCSEQTINVLHPTKWWSMTFEAYDVDTSLPIENMRVTVNQSCVIDPTHPLKQYLFTGADGKGTFIGLSASVLSVRQGHPDYMGEAGYTNFDIAPFGDAFCTYWSIATYFNKSSGENYQGNVSKDCNIHFKDQNGYVDNHINDTDTYVDLYYDNGNCSATLKFQRLYGTYWMSKMSWNIPINESGYKRIYNINFSEHDANYRGYMYATECSCNSTMPLYVKNETVQEEQHYENLSTYIRFNHQMGAGQVDYRSPIEIATYAYTNTSAHLLNINLTLYEQTTQIATIALDWADFAGASPKWYYTWTPSVNYDIGKNYTVVMTGYNGLNLGADDVWTSNIRNNKLTIHVKDNHNAPINYATVFVEGWGSQPLESSTDIEITGFDNGDVQYKATKSGYTSSGWATVTFDDDDETVTCILVKESTTRVTGYKLRNDEIKDFFIPVMYLLLMFMLIGAFFHVSGRR